MSGQGRTAVIVGAGLAGALMACYLARAGWTVRVFERRPDPRRQGYGGGRSINLALSARGFWGLAGVGLDEVVRRRDAIPMPGRMIHPVNGPLVFQPYSARPGDAINSVSRGGLNLTLIEAAAAIPGVELAFDHACVDVDLAAPAAILSNSAATVRAQADLVIGADGAFSAVRGVMQKTDRYEYSQSYLGHGYKELHIPPARDDTFAMEPGALHIWPRGGAMMIALPNRDASFTCTLFWPFEGEHSFAALGGADAERVRAFFRAHYPDAVPLMPTLPEDFTRNPTSSLVTVRCWPWRTAGKGGGVVLIGDAAHAIVPFYGQGINCGFEDCRVLADCLARHADPRAALDEYQALRKPNADAIAEMALENFVEMRDKTGQPAFRYKKKVEQAVHAALGDRAEPQYNLVSFSTVPYTEARRRGRALDAVLQQVVARVPESVLASAGEPEWRRRVVEAAAALLADAEAESSKPRIGDRPAPDEAASPANQSQAVIDITPAVTARLAVWPGDTALSREVLLDIDRGANITLSTLRSTVHLGAHADGPNHYGRGAPGIGERSLEHYIGPCRVVAARVARGARVRPQDVAGLDRISEPRVLIRTGTFPDPERWNPDFAALSVELIDALAAQGVITIGIDTPSVDSQDSKDLPAHHAMLRHDMAILEGLALADVAPGRYELIALPLRLMGFDASPVRAVLRRA